MQFEFATAARIIFGAGKLESIGDIASVMGDRALVARGGPPEAFERLRNLLGRQGISCLEVKIDGEPTTEMLSEALRVGNKTSVSLVIGIGGGSAIDIAKVVAALLTNPGDLMDYLEVIGQGKPLTKPALPLIAIPTTAGTGAEVTRNAVIGSMAHHVKVSLRSPYLLPRIALVDPALTIDLPPQVTAFTGMDALTQLIESYTSNNSNPLTDTICEEGLRSIGSSFYRAYDDGKDVHAREEMCIASLFSGLALANAKLGAVHGLAGPIGGEVSAHHGAICACLLPQVMEANFTALRDRSPDHPALQRYTQLAKQLTGRQDACAENGIQWVNEISSHMKIQPLSSFGLSDDNFPSIMEKAQKASSMQGNPITLFEDELRSILQKAL